MEFKDNSNLLIEYKYDVNLYKYSDLQTTPIQKGNNILGSGEKEYVAYSFTGEPLKWKCVYTAPGKSTQTEVCTCEYDHARRLSTTKYKLNTNEEVTLVENTYDDLGRIKSGKCHGHSALT